MTTSIVKDLQRLNNESTLAVIGGGPKAAAIAAKAAVLRELGLGNVHVCVIEAKMLAANWDGKNGFTNGQMPLGTNPEKDCGFPYACGIFSDQTINAKINKAMLAYSWQAFNVEKKTYSEWIDRGRQPPSHQQFAEYLKWVLAKANARVMFATAHQIIPKKRGQTFLIIEPHSDIEGLEPISETIKVREKNDSEPSNCLALPIDGVVLTGPGDPIPIEGTERFNSPKVLDGKSYWQHERDFEGLRNECVGVIGGGETAATILLSLIERTKNSCKIELLSASGLIYTRGEGYHENQVYSHPEKWQEIEEIRRPDVIRHTDRGVFSVHARTEIDKCDRIQVLRGYVDRICHWDNRVGVDIRWNSKSGQKTARRLYDRIVLARGFDGWHLPKKLLPDYFGEKTNRRDIQENIDYYLRLPFPMEDVNIHVPALSGYAQGPGFMNLSCLGTLADRVLYLYLDSSENQTLAGPHRALNSTHLNSLSSPDT